MRVEEIGFAVTPAKRVVLLGAAEGPKAPYRVDRLVAFGMRAISLH